MGHATVNMNKKNTVTGNDADIWSRAAPSARASTPRRKDSGGRNTNPDSPARQLMHKEGPLRRAFLVRKLWALTGAS